MQTFTYGARFRKSSLAGATILATCSLTFAVTPNARTFTADEAAKVQGVIVSRDGQVIKLRTADDSIGTVDITNETKIQLKKGGIFHRTSTMDAAALVPGLTIDVDGKGNDKGELVASKVQFDPNSMRASRAIDTRVSPLESRTGTLEGKETTLEGRAGQLETRAGQMEDAQKQTNQQVTQVKGEADQANQGVSTVNTRVTNLDNYQSADSATVYFKINSYALSPEAKQQLDAVAQKAQSAKGYMVEVAGYADTTGKAAKNQVLSEQRADAVTQYLEQQGNIPIHRIIRPTGMGTSHEAASNDTADGRKMNRRVEVKVLVNEGLVGGSGAAAQSNPPATPATDTTTNH